ncbi:MAG: DNA translocase FtsK 4TM domain-containing protein, partial [Bacteroidetes bacterium]|nr:DNA translocase FtsK 4TM domain-containing protein [Bacteroidota bacterium]
MFLFSKNKKVKKITKTDPKQKEKVSRIHFRNATGLTFILISVFLFIAFSSYLFKWKGDQSAVINRNFIELISNSDLQTENALGKVGAYVSHQLFYNGFGLSSFLIVGMFLLIGMKLSLHLKKISYLIVSKYSLFFLIWFSITLSLLNANSGFAWGGIVGNYSKDVLASFLGGVGVPILLFFSLLLFFVIEFKLNFDVALLKGMTFFKSGVPKMDGPVVELNIEEPIQVDEPVPATKEEVKDQPELELEIEEEEPKEENTVEVLLNVDEVEPLMEEEIDTDSEIKLGIEHTEEEKILDEEEAVITNYDPTLDLPNYKYPTVDLLNEIDAEKVKVDKEELKENTDQIMETLNNYNIQIERIKATIGPTVTLYEIVPTPGTRISKIKNLEDDIALSLSALGIRIIAPIPGKGTIGIEVPNKQREIVPIRTMLSSEKFQLSQMDLPIVLGKT